MYLMSILAVLWTPSPSTVVRRASWRALSFPFGFLLTVFPQWLVYTGLRDDAWPSPRPVYLSKTPQVWPHRHLGRV